MKAIRIIALIATIAIPSSSFAWGPRGGGFVVRPFFPGAIIGGHFGRVPGSLFVNRALLPPSLFFPYYNNYYSLPPPPSGGTAYERGYSEGYSRGYEEALREASRERYDEDKKRGREQGQDDNKGGE
jgi:hypothetical protein